MTILRIYMQLANVEHGDGSWITFLYIHEFFLVNLIM